MAKTDLVWLLLLLAGLRPAVYADNQLSEEDKRWLEQEVAPLLTPEEIEVFKDIDSKDRQLFKQIFWARRDPNPSTPENEFREAFESSVEIADRQLTEPGRKGSTTDMGRVFVLLGKPDRQDSADETGIENRSESGTMEPNLSPVESLNEETEPNPSAFSDAGLYDLGESNSVSVVTWDYAPNANLGFPAGLTVEFRAMPGFGYRIIRTDEIDKVLERLKTLYISNPNLTYNRDSEGRLINPGKDIALESTVYPILTSMRETQVTSSDLRFESTIAYFRSNDGAVYIPILFELMDASAAVQAATVFGLLENAEGESVQEFEEQTMLLPGPDRGVRYEIPTQAPPGRYKLYLGIRDDRSEAVGTQILDLDVPDYSSGNLTLSSVVLYREGNETPEPAGTPGHAFQFGSVKFQPARTFTQQDTLGFFFFVYGLGFDASGNADITGQYIFYKDEERKGQTREEALLVEANHAMGNAEIPLSAFQPGNYRMEVRVVDRVLNQLTIKDVAFVLRESP